MATTIQTSPPDSGPQRGLPRWAWVLVALLAAVALVAVAVAVFAVRGRTVAHPASPPSPAASASPSSSASQAATATLADGCLGGVAELDRAVLAAQRQAPLTPAGAASFTATVIRWAFAGPPPPYQQVTARQVLTDNASPAARRSLSSTKDLAGSTGGVDFTDGKYYVESFDGDSAIVSYVGGANPTLNGVPQGAVLLGGAAHLEAVNGTWHYKDLTSERSIEDLQRIGIPYSGGC